MQRGEQWVDEPSISRTGEAPPKPR